MVAAAIKTKLPDLRERHPYSGRFNRTELNEDVRWANLYSGNVHYQTVALMAVTLQKLLVIGERI